MATTSTQRYIKVHKQAPAVYVEGRTTGYRLVLTITEAVNIDKYLFVFQKRPADTAGNIRSEFTNIASPADVEEYPVGYNPNDTETFFRSDTVDLVFRTLDLLNDAWRLMEVDFTALIETYCQMDNFVEEDVEFGVKSSSSSSTPSSSSSSVAP